MKFVVLKNPKEDHDFFIFPKTVTLEDFLQCATCIRNKTWGDWERIRREFVVSGELDKLLNVVSCPEEFKDDVEKLKEAFLSTAMKFVSYEKYNGYEGDGGEEIFMFPNNINHDCFHESILQMDDYRKKIGAGFVRPHQRHVLECYGESETLGLKCRMNEDNILIQLQLQDRQEK